MTRRRYAQLTLAQVVLFGVATKPEELLEPRLRRIDELLDDDQLVDEIFSKLARRWPQSRGRGRYSTPAEVVLRMLVLKHLKQWTYEQLEWEVTGNLGYRHLCRIGAEKVPDAKTMVRYGQLVDEVELKRLLERVVHLAADLGVTRGEKMRVDTTVVEADVRHPTDSGLCADVVRVFLRWMRRLVEAGVKLPFRIRDVTRSVSRRMREIGQALRRKGDDAKRAIVRPYRRLLRVTRRIVKEAQKAAKKARREVKQQRGKARRKIERTLRQIEAMLPHAHQVLKQTRLRIVGGETASAGKIISIFDPWAQILRRGKLHRPTEFGLLVKVQEADGGIVTDVATVPGKADAPLLVPAIECHKKLFGRAPRLLATDRGFHSADGERRAAELGVERIVVPKPGYRSEARIAHERKRWFRRGRAWRAGGEARISRLKSVFGMRRSTYGGKAGLERTTFWAAISNNLVAIAARTA
jgi:IS5 family transposase